MLRARPALRTFPEAESSFLSSIRAGTALVVSGALAFVVSSDAPRLTSHAGQIAASIEAPQCNGQLEVQLRNETSRPVEFLVTSDAFELIARTEVLPRKRTVTVTYVMQKPTETVNVEASGKVIASRKIGRPDPCLVEDRIDWKEPIRYEEFAGNSIDVRNWAIYDSPRAKQHPRTRHAVTQEDGLLKIAGGFYGIDGEILDVSGGIAHKFGQMYGRWEARVRADPGEGYSPVVLLWPDTEKWPDDGEVDVIEVPATNRQVGASFLHNGPNDDKIQRAQHFDWTQWHVVSVEWLPNRVTIAVDGVDQWHVTDPKYIPSTSPMHLTLQNDKGTPFTEARTPATPARVTMYVDWIKMYEVPDGLVPSSVAMKSRVGRSG